LIPSSNVPRIEKLSPWALRPTITGGVLYPPTRDQVPALLQPVAGGLLPIGALRSYGDSCVNPGGTHLSTNAFTQFFEFDEATGAVSCDSGVTLRTILERTASRGWFLPIVPGTMLSSVGGAVSCDVHGKSHHRHGSFSASVIQFELITANGQTHICSREQNPELFWATIGGLGQTGVITRVSLELARISSAYISMQHARTQNLEETLKLCLTLEDDFSVCWVDSLARGKHLGRGVLMVGHHASAEEVAELSPDLAPFSSPRELHLKLPFFVPSVLTGQLTWRAFNAAYYAAEGRHPPHRLLHYRPYFFPLDGVAHWNRIYGRNGFLEYQFAVPIEAAEPVCREVLDCLSRSGNGSFLAVLKRLGPSSGGHLSFPIEGITLAVDMPAGGPEQDAILRHLDEVVANAGGRIYLVKDSRMDASFVPRMYPRLNEWAEIVNRHDPEQLFTSSMVRRLNLRGLQ
jgi:decaprenylphospho-beta-D-ribofuranose 2-oxidase